MPISVLCGLDAGGGERIPFLEEALACLNGRAGAMIELKESGIADEVCAVVQAAHFQGPVIFASFFHEELLILRGLMSDVQTLALLEGSPVHPTAFARDAGATHVGLALDYGTAALIHAFQAQDIKTFIYTVDEPEDMARMRRLGVDGIISDFPERIP